MKTIFRNNMDTELDEQLRQDRPWLTAPPGFADRVMRSIEQHDRREARAPIHAPRFFWRLAAVSLPLVAAAAVYLAYPRREAQEVAATQSHPALPIPKKFPEITAGQLDRLTARLNQPLEQELQYVINDTQQAIRFVAANFMPSPAP